jgi:hypothetical protein
MRDIPDRPAQIKSAVDLKALAEQIEAEHQAGEKATQRGLEHYRAAGEKLLQAKAKVKRGEWLPWLKANIKFPYRTVARYMALAKCDVTSNLSEEWRRISGNDYDDEDGQITEVEVEEEVLTRPEPDPRYTPQKKTPQQIKEHKEAVRMSTIKYRLGEGSHLNHGGYFSQDAEQVRDFQEQMNEKVTLRPEVPLGITADKLLEDGLEEDSDLVRKYIENEKKGEDLTSKTCKVLTEEVQEIVQLHIIQSQRDSDEFKDTLWQTIEQLAQRERGLLNPKK